MADYPAFTLVTTVFNEADRLEDTLADIDRQTWLPAEVIVVDAGSKDGTVDILKRWAERSTMKVRVPVLEGCNIAEGRNYAIRVAENELIASTDFGCRYEPEWLESLIRPFQEKPETRVVAGNFTALESLVDTLAARADYILQEGYQYQMDEYFVPSSRSIAYYRSVWEEVGGYLEWLTLAADDTIFYYLIKKKGIPMVYVDRPLVYWLRHKRFRAFGKESYRYGLGQGEGRVSFRNFWSNVAETGLRWSIPLHAVAAATLPLPTWVSGGLGLVQLFGLRSYVKAYRKWQKVRSEKIDAKAFLAALYLIEINRYQHIKGYIDGYWRASEAQKAQAQRLQTLLQG